MFGLSIWALGGYLTQQEVQRSLYEVMDDIQICFQQSSVDDSLAIQMAIDNQGKAVVTDVIFALNANPSITKCVQTIVEQVGFTPSPELLNIEWKLLVKENQAFPLPPEIKTTFVVQFPGLLHRKESLSIIVNYLTAKGGEE